jgi:hypothetical protein
VWTSHTIYIPSCGQNLIKKLFDFVPMKENNAEDNYLTKYKS